MENEMILMSEDDSRALCPWLLTSKVNIPLLSDWQDPTRDCADWWIENTIGDMLAGFLGSRMTHQSVGNFPEYDIILDGNNFIEIKISTFNSDSKVFIETHKEQHSPRGVVPRKTPSGLTLSRAQYYVLMNPGRSKVGQEYKDVMKLRFVKTEVLRELANTTVETSIAAQGAKKSFGFEIDLHDPTFEDGCLGHFDYCPETKTVDFSSFVRYKKEIAKVAAEFNRTPIPGVTTQG